MPLLSVVRLWLTNSSRFTPVTESAPVWWWNPLARGCPVPTIPDCWLKVLPLTPLEVTLSASGPYVGNVIVPQDVLHPVILSLGGDADGVHAELPAVVPGPLPVQLGIPTSFTPREMIGLAKSGLMDNS